MYSVSVGSPCVPCPLALGCPDLVPVANSWITRIADIVKIRCNFTRDIYELKCVDHRWVGYAGNCSAALLAVTGNNVYAPEPVVPYGVSIVIVLGIALIIGLMVLAVGLIILRREYELEEVGDLTRWRRAGGDEDEGSLKDSGLGGADGKAVSKKEVV
ncbi:hypothetical protein LSAT2_014421 [Lamellibrachia satsuma]|nr:hypothetical protein LSAT2_014421 [Lamellibrachia satsuma]